MTRRRCGARLALLLSLLIAGLLAGCGDATLSGDDDPQLDEESPDTEEEPGTREPFSTVSIGCYRVSHYGTSTVVYRYAPVAVSPCIWGGSAGRGEHYYETSHETYRRTYGTFGRFSSAALAAIIPRLSEVFGMNVSGSVSSIASPSLTGWIPAYRYGKFYRQTRKLARRAYVYSYCEGGSGTYLGYVQLTDWRWVHDLGIGTTCPPPTHLPPAS
jgi:hypothetical protein